VTVYTVLGLVEILEGAGEGEEAGGDTGTVWRVTKQTRHSNS